MECSILRAFVVTVSLPLSVVSCDSQQAPPSTDAAAPAQPAGPAQDSASAQPSATPAAQGPAALATAEGETPGLAVEIQELKRTAGDTVTLKLAFANSGQQEVKMDQFGGPGFNVWSLAGVTLVDIVGKKKYFTASDSDGKCLCSMDISALQPQARVNLWAKFPAPPPDVQTISVMIPHFAPIDDVPLS